MRQMNAPESNLRPDLITFSTLLKGYCHIGDIDKALQVAESIKMRGLRCDELVYNTLMDGCVKAHDAAAGIGLFEEMVRNVMKPSSITHSILARLHQTAGFGDDASEAIAALYQYHGLERPASKTWSRRGAGMTNSSNSMTGFDHRSMSSAQSMQMGYGQQMSFAAQPSMSPVIPAPPQASPGWNPSNGLYLPIEELQPLRMPQAACDASPFSCSPMLPSSMFAQTGCVPQSPFLMFNCGSSPSACSMSMPMGAQQIYGGQAGMPLPPLPPFVVGNLVAPQASDASNLSTLPNDRRETPMPLSAPCSNTGQAYTMTATTFASPQEQCQPQSFDAENRLNNKQDIDSGKLMHVSPPQALPACTILPGRFGG